MLGRTKIVSMCLKIVTYTFKALLPVQLFLNRKRQFYMSGCWYEWLLVHVTSYNFIDNYYPSLLLVEFCYRSFFVHITAISNQKKLVLYEWLFVRVTRHNFIGLITLYTTCSNSTTFYALSTLQLFLTRKRLFYYEWL